LTARAVTDRDGTAAGRRLRSRRHRLATVLPSLSRRNSPAHRRLASLLLLDAALPGEYDRALILAGRATYPAVAILKVTRKGQQAAMRPAGDSSTSRCTMMAPPSEYDGARILTGRATYPAVDILKVTRKGQQAAMRSAGDSSTSRLIAGTIRGTPVSTSASRSARLTRRQCPSTWRRSEFMYRPLRSRSISLAARLQIWCMHGLAISSTSLGRQTVLRVGVVGVT